MEKKDWKQRLGSYDSWAMNESMFITIDGETIYTLDKLLDFIQQELDKAREEGKGRKLQGWECPKCGSVYSPLTFECPTCKNSGIKVRTSDRTSGYDNTSYLN